MVLSNKKLKQKLRANLAESSVQSEIQNNSTNSLIQHSLKSLLDSAINKPRLSKREKRRENNDGDSPAPNNTTGGAGADVQIGPQEEKVKKTDKKKKDADENGASEKLKLKSAPNNTSGGAEAGVQIGPQEEKVKKSNKKRKRDADENGDSEKLKPKSTTKKKKKKKKKQKKNNKQKNKVSDGGEVENIVKSEVEVSGEQSVAETIKNNYSEEKVELSTKVYVGGIPYYSTVDDIRSFFESCGSITNIDCMLFPDSGKFRGIAIISFKTEAAAKRALELDGADMGGLFLKIQLYKATREHKPSDFSPAIIDGYNRIYIGNLSWDITEDEIRSFFSDFSISSIRLGQDKETKEFKGFAHVDFVDSLSVTMALKLDQKILRGRPARIRCAVPKKAAAPASTSMTPAGGEVEMKHVEMSEKNDYAGISEKNNYAEMSENVDNGEVVSGKIRRRRCYECGEKGHVSSDCPKKPAAVVIDSGRHFEEMSENLVEVSEKADSVASGKIRRRTCYECGEKGHLSSDCPKKAGEVIDSVKMDYGEDLSEKPALAEMNEKFDNGVGGSGGGAGGVVSVPSGKIRRRTCYECGEKGHLSSACPKKTSV